MLASYLIVTLIVFCVFAYFDPYIMRIDRELKEKGRQRRP